MAWTLARASSETVQPVDIPALRWGFRTSRSCAAVRSADEPRCSDDFAGTHWRRLTRAPDAGRAVDQVAVRAGSPGIMLLSIFACGIICLLTPAEDWHPAAWRDFHFNGFILRDASRNLSSLRERSCARRRAGNRATRWGCSPGMRSETLMVRSAVRRQL